eukprot:7130936-Prymnesium_polylepis.1
MPQPLPPPPLPSQPPPLMHSAAAPAATCSTFERGPTPVVEQALVHCSCGRPAPRRPRAAAASSTGRRRADGRPSATAVSGRGGSPSRNASGASGRARGAAAASRWGPTTSPRPSGARRRAGGGWPRPTSNRSTPSRRPRSSPPPRSGWETFASSRPRAAAWVSLHARASSAAKRLRCATAAAVTPARARPPANKENTHSACVPPPLALPRSPSPSP